MEKNLVYNKIRITVVITFGKTQTLAEKIYINENLRVYQIPKWRWYFNYILAQQIIKMPKHYCRIDYVRKIVEPNPNQVQDDKKRELTKLKSNITRLKNKLAAFEERCKKEDPLNIDPYTEWNNYKMAVCRIQNLEKELEFKRE